MTTSQPQPRMVEVYDCGCNVRLYTVDHTERDDLNSKPAMVTELTPCASHRGKVSGRPTDSRLVSVKGEPESHLNE